MSVIASKILRGLWKLPVSTQLYSHILFFSCIERTS